MDSRRFVVWATKRRVPISTPRAAGTLIQMSAPSRGAPARSGGAKGLGFVEMGHYAGNMAHPATGLARVSRATVLGLVAFVLALSAHLAAGGRAPSPAVACVLVVACCGVCLSLTSRRLGTLAIATTLGVFQLGLHYSFMWLTSAGCVAASAAGMAPVHAQSGGHGVLSCTQMSAQGMSSITHVSAAWMLAAHAVATVATAWVMARGERRLWLMVSAVRAVFSALGPVQILPSSRRFGPSLTLGSGRGLVALGGIGRRGPPAQGLYV